MIYAIIFLTISALCATLYSRWRAKQALLEDVAIKAERAKIDALKESIERVQKEVEDAGKDYNSVYDSYQRKYNKSPRDPNTKQ
jgi:hypothetical protein